MKASFYLVYQEIYQNLKINVFHFVQGAFGTLRASYDYVTITLLLTVGNYQRNLVIVKKQSNQPRKTVTW